MLVFEGILASHFAPSTRCFYTLFPPRKLPTTRDVVHSTTTNGFSPFRRRECFYERSSSLSRSFQRERKRSHHSFSHTDLFRDLNAKALECRASFSTHTGCFCPKKKRRSSLLNARKFSRVLKHFLKRVSRTKANNENVFRESERDSLCVDVVRKRLEDAFYSENVLRETTESERECETISSVSSSKLRGVLDERTSDQRRRRRRSERRFEIIRSFGDFSRSGRA